MKRNCTEEVRQVLLIMEQTRSHLEPGNKLVFSHIQQARECCFIGVPLYGALCLYHACCSNCNVLNCTDLIAERFVGALPKSTVIYLLFCFITFSDHLV